MNELKRMRARSLGVRTYMELCEPKSARKLRTAHPCHMGLPLHATTRSQA